MVNTNTLKQPVNTGFKRSDLHQQVTDTIIQQLEKGTVPWQKPWTGTDNGLLVIPKNFTTGNRYKGINILLLWGSAISQEFSTSEWASFKQWSEKKEMIRKGEKGSLVVYYDTIEKEVEGEIKKIPFLKSSYVFNRCQLTSFKPAETIISNPTLPLVERIDQADTFIKNTGAIIEHQGSSAFYNRLTDKIQVPPPETYIDTQSSTATEGYYSTLLHELTHWSGSSARLNRTKGKRFGDDNYATEELVAELGAAFLCAELEITSTPKADHASYIGHWLQVLKENKHCVITAASEASKALSYLQELQIKA